MHSMKYPYIKFKTSSYWRPLEKIDYIYIDQKVDLADAKELPLIKAKILLILSSISEFKFINVYCYGYNYLFFFFDKPFPLLLF